MKAINRKEKKSTEIRELPKLVADKIAAGEVVDRPISIVKELVENAIDADATSIIVEIKNGGKTYIRVTDNGSGIPKEQVELAFKRHATSKIQVSEDLDHITSLGFRGEALSSIAAVSRVELITKENFIDGESSLKSGISIKIEGGEVVEKNEIGCQEGTTIIVSDLFYNTPARFKFMKPDNTESSLIIDFISKMALAYPNLKIRLINNNNILFSTNGKGDILSNIFTIYSKEMSNQLIHFIKSDMDMQLEAFISSPQNTNATRKKQIFFVNGRYINSKLLETAIKEGYQEKLFDGRFPTVFLFLHINPELLDVNIHPNKKEVRFEDESKVKYFVSHGILENLNTKLAIPEIKKENIFALKATQSGDTKQAKDLNFNVTTIQVDIKSLQKIEEEAVILPLKTQITKAKVMESESLVKEATATYIPTNMPVAPIKKEPFQIEEIQTSGSIFGTYILGTDADCLYLIDQHAAHERIFYEELLESYQNQEKLQQQILIPLILNVTFSVKNDTLQWLDFLSSIGFHLEEFGEKTYRVTAIPMFMELQEGEHFLKDFLESISENTDFKDMKKIEKIISKSCKSAVKAHDLLDEQEIKKLMLDLAKCKNPYSCPHGRPIFVKMTQYEIEKMFKRV